MTFADNLPEHTSVRSVSAKGKQNTKRCEAIATKRKRRITTSKMQFYLNKHAQVYDYK